MSNRKRSSNDYNCDCHIDVQNTKRHKSEGKIVSPGKNKPGRWKQEEDSSLRMEMNKLSCRDDESIAQSFKKNGSIRTMGAILQRIKFIRDGRKSLNFNNFSVIPRDDKVNSQEFINNSFVEKTMETAQNFCRKNKKIQRWRIPLYQEFRICILNALKKEIKENNKEYNKKHPKYKIYKKSLRGIIRDVYKKIVNPISSEKNGCSLFLSELKSYFLCIPIQKESDITIESASVSASASASS